MLAVLLSVTLSGASYADADDSRTIRVVMDDNYPPYSFRDSNGKLQGITIEHWRLFEEKTGIKVEITGMEWNKAYGAMVEGIYDVVDTISYNEDREKLFDFTEAYATIDVPIFFHENISGITGVESIKGFAVAAKRGDNAISELKKNGITNILVYDSAEAVVTAAKNKEIVMFVMGKPPSMYYMYKMGIEKDFHYSTSPLYTSKFYRAVKDGNKELLDTLKSGFSKISAHEYKQIQDKWYGYIAPSIYESKYFKIVLSSIIIAIAVVCVLILWTRMLQSRVRQKTRELSETVEELQKSEARIRALLEAIPDIFFLLDSSGVIMDYHATEEEKLFINQELFLQKSLSEIFPRHLSEKFNLAIKESLETKKTITIEYTLQIKDMRYDFEARLVACGKDSVVGIVRDITDRKKAEEKLVEISIHDSLTGLFNRYCFENEISGLQSGQISALCVAVFDLDGLKLINDTMGHAIGDEYLVTAARIIERSFPKGSMIFRIGGDEFSILIVNKSKDEIHQHMNCFKEEIEKFNRQDHVIQISISVGYVISEGKAINIHEMIKEADNRMYRVKLHRRKSMKSEVVQTMKNMLEARDFITEGHANRMEELAVAMAQEIGMAEKDIADIRLLAQFHDIGKVGIPDHILFKPSKLNDEEYEIMKRHTEIGHRIAESSVDLMPIAEFILKHHEYWNGKGYPFGIKGVEIPVECRILSIVDAYDAMTNDRPYRKALSREMALEELKRCAGSQFDPQLVDVFIDLMDNWKGVT